MSNWQISESIISDYYETLNRIGCLGESPEAGFLRAAYSNEETEAMRFVEKRALAIGATSRWDAIGNLFLEWPAPSARFVEVGSHLDTVPLGGNFDGAAGIVGGIAAIQRVLENTPQRKNGLRLRIWRAEESVTFSSVYAGSLGAFGKFNSKALGNRFRGRSLEEAMKSQGADPEVARAGRATISQAEIDSIVAHIEMHIEQGNVLEVEAKDIGIITSIRGPYRLKIELSGEFDHSGATPMGVKYRHDCNLALAYIMVRLDEMLKVRVGEGKDLIQTVGVINSFREMNESQREVYQNAPTKVSGFAYFTFDVRSNSRAVMDAYIAEASELIKKTAAEYRVDAEIELIGRSNPLESVDEVVQKKLESAATVLGFSSKLMPSGAGHDAAIVGGQRNSAGKQVPIGMVFIPCRRGKSHCPEEYTSYEAIAKGASVMARAISELVNE